MCWVNGSGWASTTTWMSGPATWLPGAGAVTVSTGAGRCSATPGDAADVPTWLTARTIQEPAPSWESSTSRAALDPPGSVTKVLSPPGERWTW